MTVHQLVSRERRRLRLAMLARGLAAALAIVAVIAAASALALGGARWIAYPSAPIIAWVIAAIAAGLALWWTGRALRRRASRDALASAIERERALRAGSLRGAMEVAQSGVLGRRAADALATYLGGARGTLAPTLQRRARWNGAVACVGAIAAVGVLGAARHAMPDGWHALSHPVGALTGSILPPLTITDVPRFVLRGEKLRVRVLAPERRELELHMRTTGAAWNMQTLRVSGGSATSTIGPLDADVMLVAADGRTTSDTTIVRVTDRPFVGDVAIHATYPAYLGRAPETIATGEPVRVPRGTSLTIEGRASVELSTIVLVRGSDTLRLAPDGHVFTGRMEATESGRWVWSAAGAHGPIADLPTPLELDVMPDSAPRVDILSPESDTAVIADSRLPLRVAVTDDHGIRSVALRSWRTLADGRAMPDLQQPLATPNAPQWNGEMNLDLSARSLQPGDALHMVVIATDDSPWRQRGTSREIVVRVPSLTEQRELARQMADSTAAHAAVAAKAEHDLAERTEAAARSRSDRNIGTSGSSRSGGSRGDQQRSMSYQSAEQAKALAQDQQALQQQVRSLQNDAQALERQLRAAGALDSTLQKQLRDVQSLLQQALTPELQKQLQDLLKATQQLSGEDARNALQNLAQAQQRLREALERSAEMLKRAALEGSMQTLRDDARDIAAREHQVADSLSRGDSSAAQQAGPLSERSRNLAQQIQQLAQRLQQEKAQAGPQKLQNAAQQAQQSATSMQQAASEKSGNQAEQQRQQQAAARGSQQQQVQGQSPQRQGTRGQQQGQQQQHGQQGQQQQGQLGQQGQQGQMQQGQQGQLQQGTLGQGSLQQPGQRRSAATAAREAAQQMDQAAQQLSDARSSQIQEWKNQMTSQLDRSIQETMQLARQQQELAQRARSGKPDPSLRGDQSAIQQGIEKVGQRLEQAARQSSNISSQSQRAVGEARQRVADATQQAAQAQGRSSPQMAQAMDQASQALTKAAAELVKDRTRVASAQSASGFEELLQRMREAAKEQGSLNAQSAQLMPIPGGQPNAQMMAEARALAQRQRALAQKLDDVGQGEAADRAAQLAKEMRQIASQLQSGRVDQSLLDRQQRLFHRLLDAGLSMEKDEREDTGKRDAVAATGHEGFITPGTDASGRSAVRYREPDWKDLRGLSADERRAVLEYFKRINAERP